MAINSSGGQGQFDLIDVIRGAELATLSPVTARLVGGTCFSPDSRWFAVACYASHSIQLWDLHTIHDQLTDLNLHWPRSEDRAPLTSEWSQPLQIEVLLGDLGKSR